MTQSKPASAREQADLHVQEKALRVAKSTLTPGQTKEQTKLIAKGIEKGIAVYKQQQSAKARERDKARKKAQKQRTPESAGATDPLDEPQEFERDNFPAKPALLTAGMIFSLAALLHGVRFWLGWPVAVGGFEIPVAWSLAGTFVAAALASWMFSASRD